jgi:hypothetical protein
MSIEAGAILRVVAELIMPGATVAQNVYYATFNDTGGSNADQDVVDDLVDWVDDIYNQIVDQMDDAIVAGEVKVYIWDTLDLDWDEIGSGVATFVPASVDEMLPHGVAAVMTGRTFDADVNGRKFFAGFAEDEQNQSNWNSGALTNLLLAGAQWLTTFSGAATGSTFYPGVWSTVQVVFRRFVDNLIVNGIAGYQRRRKPGVGI